VFLTNNFFDDLLIAKTVLERQNDRLIIMIGPAFSMASLVWKDFTRTMMRSAGPIPSQSVFALALTFLSDEPT